MEALLGDSFSGPGPSFPPGPTTPASEGGGGGGRGDHPWSRSPTADLMSDRSDDVRLGGDCGSGSGSPSSYTCYGGGGVPGGWGNERGERKSEGDGGADGVGEAGSGGRGFFEFYPFLNDAAHNEVDGEAR